MNRLIEMLIEAYQAEMQAVYAYSSFASQLTGLPANEVKDYFQSEAHEELEHSFYFADRISAMGGEPTAILVPLPTVNNLHDALEHLLDEEEAAIDMYTNIAKHANNNGDYSLAIGVEDIIMDERKHRDELLMMLR